MGVTDFDPSTATEADEFDPSSATPHPDNVRDLFKSYAGREPENQGEIDSFVKEMQPDQHPISKELSAMSGLPRLVASAGAAVLGGATSLATHAVLGTAGLVAGPATGHTADLEDFANRKAREWSSTVSNLGNYIPATAEGAQLASVVGAAPATIVGALADSNLKPHMSDNAYQALGDVTQDLATDLSGLGAPGILRGAGRLARAAKEKVTPAPSPTPEAPAAPPPVSAPLSGADLRAQPNPIPAPDGTVHAAVHPAALPPKEAPATSAEAPAAPVPPSSETGGTTVAPTPTNAAPEPSPAAAPEQPTAQTPPATVEDAVARANDPYRFANGTMGSPDSMRGSVSLFNEPAKEGPQEIPAPEKQNERAGHLDALNQLTEGGLPTRRLSAINGDYNATGDDWQAKETGSPAMRQQIATENAALHKAADTVHGSVGSEFGNSVDSQTLDDRGRVIRNAIQGIQDWFGKATDQLYDGARAANQGRPIAKLERVSNYLNDDSNFTNDAEIGLQRAAKQRLNRLWTTGDPDGGVPPGSVNAAERFREFLNEKGKNPSAMGVASDLKNHLDMDVAEHGGPGLFETARAMRRHSYQMLEEPTGIKKLLAPSDSQGINHAIPTHKVADYIADLPTDQHAHVLNVLRAGAHLGGGELAESSAAALREIQAHVVSRMHAAATNADGSWNARKFYNAADRYARNAPELFKERPDVLKNLKTINDAGNTLHMDKHYPGAGAQIERTGLAARGIKAAGGLAASIAHEIPAVGRIVGRAIETGVEKTTGEMGAAAREKAVRSRIVDRTGKMRGSVQVMREKSPADKAPADKVLDEFNQKHPTDAPAGYLGKRVGSSTAELYKDPGDPNTVHLEKLAADHPGGGHGTAALREITDLADKHGARLTLDAVPQGKNPVPRERLMDYYARHGFVPDGNTENSMTREPKGGGVQVPPGMRGSFSFQNDNPLNNATAASRNKQRGGSFGVERNPRSEYNANDQLAGGRQLSDEQKRILGRLSGQTGAVGPVGKQSTAGSRNKQRGGTLNIGLNQGNKGEPGFRQNGEQKRRVPGELYKQNELPVTTEQSGKPKWRGGDEETKPTFSIEENKAYSSGSDKDRLQYWNQLPKVGTHVDGLEVRDHVPNTDSISGSFSQYHVLSGIREIPYSAFENHITPSSLPSRLKKLRDEISENKEINPLIVGIDKHGPYIIEGVHRYDALLHLGKTKFPAKIVVGKFDHDEEE